MRMQYSSKAIKITWQRGLVGKRGYVCEYGTSRRIITGDGLDTEYMDDETRGYVCKTGLTWEQAMAFANKHRPKETK